MPGDLTFDWHTHSDHQLAWAAAGVLIVRTGTATWTLPPSRALWIPAGLRHETLSAGTATMRTLYIRPELCPISWPDFTPVAASPLLAELIGYLAEPELEAGRRQHAEALVVDRGGGSGRLAHPGATTQAIVNAIERAKRRWGSVMGRRRG